jgi:AcrR family transcriptional regulator
VSTTRQTAAQTRDAIRIVALRHFREYGYEGSQLSAIAEELGITRSAVLFHFGSKAELLQQTLAPLEASLDEMLAGPFPPPPLPVAQRRKLIAQTADHFIAHRDAVSIISRDLSSHAPSRVDERIGSRIARLATLLAGPAPEPLDRVTVRLMLGALTNAVSDQEIAAKEPETRALIIASLVAIVRERDKRRE